MKFKLREAHFDRINDLNKFIEHYNKHVAKDWATYWLEVEDELLEPMTQDDYAEIAHELSIEKVNSSDPFSGDRYVGFYGKTHMLYKYDTILHELVVFAANKFSNYIKTFYKLKSSDNHSRYMELKDKFYLGEILASNEKYNK